jgi:hypothetical protein
MSVECNWAMTDRAKHKMAQWLLSQCTSHMSSSQVPYYAGQISIRIICNRLNEDLLYFRFQMAANRKHSAHARDLGLQISGLVSLINSCGLQQEALALHPNTPQETRCN